MHEAHRAEPVHLHDYGGLVGPDERQRVGVVAGRDPAAAVADLDLPARGQVEDRHLGVPLHEAGRTVERLQERRGLRRPRPPGQVAAEHQQVDVLPLDLGEHRLEGREHAVDVVQGGDAHRRSVPLSDMPDTEIVPLARGDRVAAGEWVALYDAVLPEMAFGVEDFLHGQRRNPRGLDLLARVRGRAVGCGSLTPLPHSSTAYVWLGVLQEERRRGVGGALYDAFREAARRLGRDTFQTRVSEARPEALAFLGRRGLAEAARHQEVALELGAVAAPAIALPAGVRITTLAAEPELEDATYEVARRVIPEIPSPERRPVDRARWESWMRGPQMRPDAVFVAVDGGDVVAYAALLSYAQQPGDAIHEITAVLPEHRRRGLARALKAVEIAWAKEAGLQRLRAHNDSTNLPIRALNDELGYRPLPARIVLRGPIDP